MTSTDKAVGGSGTTREEIQALVGSPELRRIFDEEPKVAKGGAKGAGQPRGDARRNSAQHDASQAGTARRSRISRIALGLVPVYIAIPIVLYEAGPQEANPSRAFGIREAAEDVRKSSDDAKDAPPSDYANMLHRGPDRPLEKASMGRTDRAPGPASLEPGPETGSKADSTLGDKAATDLGKSSPAQPVDVGAESGVVAAAPKPSREPSPATPTPGTVRQAIFANSDADAGAKTAEPSGAGLVDAELAAAAEEGLRLSRGDRRELQRRLRLAKHDPQMIDGVFGPATRSAIESWQAAAGLPVTGYLDETAMAFLVEQTASDYNAWRAAERARAREEKARAAVVATSAPPPSSWPTGDECGRSMTGGIAYGQGMRCDVRGLREDFDSDFENLKRELSEIFR